MVIIKPEINLSKLEQNVNQIRSVSNCEIIAMIKANAYAMGGVRFITST